MGEQRAKMSPFLVLVLILQVFQFVKCEDAYRFFYWNVFYGDIYPLGNNRFFISHEVKYIDV